MFLHQKHCFGCLVLLRKAHSIVEINHYKTLGLKPTASKAEIKAAYYELSKKHHPDRNQGSQESAKIFRNVKEAYEILGETTSWFHYIAHAFPGNDQRRVQYDKDRIFKAVRTHRKVFHADNKSDYKDEAERIHFHSRARPFFRKHSFGRTTYYDFEAWYEGHYGKESMNNFTFGEPRQFKNKSDILTEREIEIFKNVKVTFICLFYLMIFLTMISVLTTNKKWKQNNEALTPNKTKQKE